MMRSLLSALTIAMVFLLAPGCAPQSDRTGTVFVYKPDGTRHCSTAPGASLDSMAQELVGHGIRVVAERRSYDGREGIAVCGEPTGSINVYEIDDPDLQKASELGFQRLDPSWLGSR